LFLESYRVALLEQAPAVHVGFEQSEAIANAIDRHLR
jgi:hypothetical protein